MCTSPHTSEKHYITFSTCVTRECCFDAETHFHSLFLSVGHVYPTWTTNISSRAQFSATSSGEVRTRLSQPTCCICVSNQIHTRWLFLYGRRYQHNQYHVLPVAYFRRKYGTLTAKKIVACVCRCTWHQRACRTCVGPPSSDTMCNTCLGPPSSDMTCCTYVGPPSRDMTTQTKAKCWFFITGRATISQTSVLCVPY